MEKLSLKEIKEIAVKARGKWLSLHASEELINKKVVSILNESFLQVILKFIKVEQILGNEYYMNGSARFFRESIGKALDRWVAEKAGQPYEITNEVKEEISKLYNKAVLESIKTKIEKVAENKAIEVIETIIDLYSKELPEEVIA